MPPVQHFLFTHIFVCRTKISNFLPPMHNSTGKCHCKHKSFLEELASNGTSGTNEIHNSKRQHQHIMYRELPWYQVLSTLVPGIINTSANRLIDIILSAPMSIHTILPTHYTTNTNVDRHHTINISVDRHCTISTSV